MTGDNVQRQVLFFTFQYHFADTGMTSISSMKTCPFGEMHEVTPVRTN